MINVFQHVNRYRMREPTDIVADFAMLYEMGVRTFKIVDELFLLNRRHVEAVCLGLAALGFRERGVSIWCYGRPDTVDESLLTLVRSAGVDWIALGIESGDESVRDGASKSMSQQDIRDIVQKIEAADINVIANYIFGLPGETPETMMRTLAMAQELNTAFANFYTAMAYPGSVLYEDAVRHGWRLPDTWAGYSQHNEHTYPLVPHGASVTPTQVLRFRDGAFQQYFTSPRYSAKTAQRFGWSALSEIIKMTSYSLRRNILEMGQ